MTHRRFLVPEVIQTSGMDCGPAALTCLLAGFGISASYGRLREACQTDVDGTSIDTVEDAARLLGLDAVQLMAPPEQLANSDSQLLPAIVIVTLPGELLHFVVVWRRHGPFLQIMDPAVGRRWVRAERFLDDVYVHEHRMPAGSSIETGDETFVTSDADGRLTVRGAVLVRVTGPAPDPVELDTLPTELRAALTEPPARPLAELASLLVRAGGRVRPAVLAATAIAAAVGVVAEALLFRGVIDGVDSTGGRFAALAGLAAVLLVLDTVLAVTGAGLGRRLDNSLRRMLFGRLPLLPDRYLRSRPTSDLAERAHRLHQLRELPALGVELVRTVTELAAVAVAIALIDPGSAVPAAVAAVAAVATAVVAQPVLVERDLRLRSHSGALARFFLDGMLGLIALRAHTAEPVVAAEHERRLGHWAATGHALARAVVCAEALCRICGVAAAVWLVWGARDRAGTEPGTFLLLVFWAVALPVLGARLGRLTRQWPWHRNVALRFLEPLTAPTTAPGETRPTRSGAGGVSIALRGVNVVASGHTLLKDLDLTVSAGERVAVVGHTGAGKSSLVGLLLGWHVPASGQILVDGRPLDPAELRQASAWVDPSVRLWNATLGTNLRYGNDCDSPALAAAIADADLDGVLADLARRPAGAQTPLGDAGGLLSGGEGQRVRLGRARLRDAVRLVLLDEPFRGLDRDQRGRLRKRLDDWWPGATLLLVTHDVGETLEFGRVLVVDGGTIVEDGSPEILAADPTSRYRALLEAQTSARAVFGGWRRLRVEAGRLYEGEDMA